ncbi:sex-determining transformer protein 1-like isoform X2 [Macrosteles quadrilineatus]|nr:sex-determining transformer protein 1-like isoform X2 [Macrosteles quadrilineatus]XP_054274823.1 sex-determining transformer protein 1-like isoform X2 [Macrosteles quadrilineatus]XP_054274825.1 sex-determining transformer protein 1-like isoform X2 [Macrosteles quadrilineatus]XP_054274826.1 sex-determining transformer protein 1-like isoform X2 [Macrosteles quadrilineatus]
MLSNQEENCFICNCVVVGKSINLSEETTVYSNTSFPSMLTHYLGDAFMVVVLEDDKICLRCTKLINQTDKLEQDLLKVQSIVRRFLNEKYDLNEELDHFSHGKDTQESYANIYNEDSLINPPKINIKYAHNKIYKPEHINQNESLNLYDTSEVKIKTETLSNCEQCPTSSDTQNVGSCEKNIYNLPQVLPKFINNLDSKHEVVASSQNVFDMKDQEFQHSSFKEVKTENLSTEQRENSIQTSFSSHITPTASFEGTKLQIRSNCQIVENKPVIDSSLNSSVFVEGLIDSFRNNDVCNIETLTNASEKISQADLPSITVEKRLLGRNKVKTLPLKRKNHELKQEKSKINKLRPILPKLSVINDIKPSFYIIQQPDITVSNKIFHELPNFTAIKPENSDLTSFSQVQLSNNEEQLGFDQNYCVANEKYNEFEILSSDNIPFDWDTDLITFKTSKPKKEHSEVTHHCRFCPKSFKRNKTLKDHEAVHTEYYGHYKICGQGFSTQPKLEQHKKMHKKEAFVCEICGKKYHSRGTFWIHRKWHENPFPYKCDDCGKPFKHSSNLSVHRRKHRGDRPYKCTYCPRTFDVPQTLKRHIILHTKQYPYKCAGCNLGFASRDKYTQHLAKKHEIHLEKTVIDPKDYKVAVYNTEKENTGNVAESEKTIDCGDHAIQVDSSNSITLLDPIDCQMEVSTSELSNDIFSTSWFT